MNFYNKLEEIREFGYKNNLILFIREKSITQNFWTNYEVEAIINLDLSVDTEISYEGMKLEEAEQKEINKLIEYLKELGFKEDANE